MFAKLKKKSIADNGALLTQTARPVLLTILADIETRNARVAIACGGLIHNGYIMAGNAEVLMLNQPIEGHVRPINLIVAHITAIQEVK